MAYTVENFFKPNKLEDQIVEYVASKNFVDDKNKPIPWKLRPVTADEEASIRNKNTKDIKDKRTGTVTQTFDDTNYTMQLTACGVVEPDLLNAKLQDSYGARGAIPLLRKMLTAGELQSLALKVIEVSGLDDIETQKSDFELDTEIVKNN